MLLHTSSLVLPRSQLHETGPYTDAGVYSSQIKAPDGMPKQRLMAVGPAQSTIARRVEGKVAVVCLQAVLLFELCSVCGKPAMSHQGN